MRIGRLLIKVDCVFANGNRSNKFVEIMIVKILGGRLCL